jgi:hypothetical protein
MQTWKRALLSGALALGLAASAHAQTRSDSTTPDSVDQKDQNSSDQINPSNQAGQPYGTGSVGSSGVPAPNKDDSCACQCDQQKKQLRSDELAPTPKSDSSTGSSGADSEKSNL